MDGNYSLSDIAAVTNENGMYGCGGGSTLLIILFLLIFGARGFGMNGGDFGNYATAASQQEILFGQQFQNLDNKLDRLGNGIADATFALNNSVTTEGRNIQMQLANCCCENLRNTDSIRAAVHEEGEATRKMLYEDKIQSMQSQISQLQLSQALCGVPKINNTVWGVYPYNNGCGCNGNI